MKKRKRSIESEIRIFLVIYLETINIYNTKKYEIKIIKKKHL